MSTAVQRAFSGGEITPSAYGRVDIAKYTTGLRTMRNFIAMKHGGAQNRPGAGFIGEIKDSSREVRFIPFVFNAEQTYMLEFGHLYVRVIRDGIYQYDLTLTITGISNANPGVVTYTGTDPSNGEEVYISGITGAIGNYLNGRNFKIANVNSGANTFELQYMDGSNVNTTSMGAYTSAGTAKRVYTLTTPYVENDLQELNYDQSADVITITHPNYYSRELTRTGHTSWTLSVITFSPDIASPTGVTNSGAAGIATEWVVTAIAEDTLEESIQSSSTGSSATPSSGSPITVSWSAVTDAQEYNVYKKINGIYGFIGTAGSTSFIDNGIDPDTTLTPPISSSPYELESSKTITGITQANPAVVTSAAHGYYDGKVVYISGVTGMTEVNGIFFICSNVTTNTFSLKDLSGSDVNSTSYTAYSANGTAQGADNFPSTSAYYQQRHLFANTNSDTEKVRGTRSGNFKNLTIRSPLQDDDAISFNLAGRQVNAVRHMLDIDGLIIFTAGGEWSIQGNSNGVLTPDGINSKQKSYYGSAAYPAPIIVGTTALFVQARSTIIRDLYNDAIEGYKGSDLTIFSSHLFEKYTIRDWAYQQIPNSNIWVVRSDGVLLCLTYIREHQFLAWSRHDFDGEVEQVACIPEGNEDAVYLLIKRTIDGETKRYVERMKTRLITDVVDSVFVDCSLSYDGRHTGSTTMTLSGGTNWTYDETLTLTASASTFTASDVGNQIFLTGADGDLLRFTIDAYSSGTVVTGNANKTVPASMRAVAITTWAEAVDEITGLWNLEGKSVSVFADSFVVANPNNSAYDEIVVTNGAVTLDRPYSVIHIGLPITSDIETLDIDYTSTETMVDKKKLITKVTAYCQESRGFWSGGETPDSDSDLTGLYETKLRDNEGYDDPITLTTGPIDIPIQSTWNSNGRVFIRNTDPIPLSILEIAPAGFVPAFKG